MHSKPFRTIKATATALGFGFGLAGGFRVSAEVVATGDSGDLLFGGSGGLQ